MSKSREKCQGARGRRTPRFPALASGCTCVCYRKDRPSETKEAPKLGSLLELQHYVLTWTWLTGVAGACSTWVLNPGTGTSVHGQCSLSPGAGPHLHGASSPASGGANPGPTRISTRKAAKLGLQLDGIRPARWSYSRKKQGQAGSRWQSPQNTLEEEWVLWMRE